MKVRVLATAVACVGLMTAAGCSSSGSSHHSAAPPFRANLDTWTLPLDSYLPNDLNQAYAQDLLYSQCMSKAGYNVPAYNIADYMPPNRNAALRKLFNLDLAERYGYHNGPTKNGGQPPKLNLTAPAEIAADSACSKSSQQGTSENSDLTNFVQNLEGDAEDNALGDSKVKAAAAAWRTCMLPQGIPDLPDSPEDMPTQSQRQRFGMNGPTNPGPGQLPSQGSASPQEIKQAVFDANCRDSTGYSKTYYDTEVADQQALITKNGGSSLKLSTRRRAPPPRSPKCSSRMAGRPKRTIWLTALLCVVLAAVFVLGWYAARRFQSPAQREAAAKPPAAGPIFDPVTQGTLSNQVSGSGAVTYSSVVSVSPASLPSPAVITGRPSASDRSIKAGDVLTEINGRPVFLLPGAFDFYRDLEQGDEGPDVAQLQRGLRAAGYQIGSYENGTYGVQTADAVDHLYHAAGYSVPDLGQVDQPAPTSSATGSRTGSGQQPSATKSQQITGIPLTEVAVTPTLPATLMTVLPVGAHPSSGDAVGKVARGQLIVSISLDSSAFVQINSGMTASITIDGHTGTVPATVSGLSAASSGGQSTVTLTPTGSVPPELAGHTAVGIVTIKVVATTALLVPSRAVATSANGTQRVLVRDPTPSATDNTISTHAVSVHLIGSLAGVSAVEPLTAGELSKGDLVEVG